MSEEDGMSTTEELEPGMVCSDGVARAEFARFCDLFDLNIDEMDEEDQESFEKHALKIRRRIMKGRMSVDDDGQLTVVLKAPVRGVESVTFYEPKGSALLALDKAKKDRNIDALQHAVVAMTRTSKELLKGMHGADVKTCQEIVVLFIA